MSIQGVTAPSAPITIGTTVTFLIFHNLIISCLSSSYFSIFSFSLFNILLSPVIATSIIIHFLFSYLPQQIRLSILYKMIALDHKIPEYLNRTCFRNCLWCMLVPFSHSAYMILATQFPMQKFNHPIMPSLILFLTQI